MLQDLTLMTVAEVYYKDGETSLHRNEQLAKDFSDNIDKEVSFITTSQIRLSDEEVSVIIGGGVVWD